MLARYETHLNFIKVHIKVLNNSLKTLFTAFGLIGDIFEITITLTACVVYVLGTYYEESYENEF